jgi:cytoskeletal protein RodZ
VSFGVSLKRERELRGISLAEIAKTTKISVRLLEAIEKDRFDILPEGVFR